MEVSDVIFYISVFFWLLPVLRQFKTAYFIYFLVNGLSDPANILLVKTFGLQPLYLHCVATLLIFYSIGFSAESIKKNLLINVLFIAGYITAFIMLDNLIFLLLPLHLLILYKFVKIAVVKLHLASKINIFVLVIIFYEITVLMKLVVYISITETGILYFTITLTFEVLVAIFFTIFREDSPSLNLSLNTTF